MKTTELRIGNKVLFKGNEKTINRIHKDVVSFEFYLEPTDNPNLPGDYIKVSIEKIEPILLTENWLSKCGFQKIIDENGREFFSLIIKNGDLSKPAIEIYNNRTVIWNNTHVKHVESIHQLQNLYFALTGDELVFK